MTKDELLDGLRTLASELKEPGQRKLLEILTKEVNIQIPEPRAPGVYGSLDREKLAKKTKQVIKDVTGV